MTYLFQLSSFVGGANFKNTHHKFHTSAHFIVETWVNTRGKWAIILSYDKIIWLQNVIHICFICTHQLTFTFLNIFFCYVLCHCLHRPHGLHHQRPRHRSLGLHRLGGNLCAADCPDHLLCTEETCFGMREIRVQTVPLFECLSSIKREREI